MNPSEPYLTPYLVEDKHFTNDEINNRIYPYWTYGQLVIVFLVPLMAKIVTPKKLFYLETLGFLFTRALLIWGSSLSVMRTMQLFYAVGTSVKSIYYSYMYLIFEKKHFGTATGFVWGAQAFGMCLSGILGQVLVKLDVSYLALNYVSMGSVCVAFIFAFFIPSKKSTSENKPDFVAVESGFDEHALLLPTTNADPQKRMTRASVKDLAGMVLAEYKQVFRLFRDSRGPMAFTWVLTKCVEDLVQNYASNLWYNLSDDPQLYGAVIALYQGLGTISALIPVGIRTLVKDESIQSNIILRLQQVSSIVLLVSLIVMTSTDRLWLAYLAYVTFGFYYYMFITGVTCNMASDSEPLEQIFLFATSLFCASSVETIITLILSRQNASPVTWFAAICVLQGLAIPVYLRQSYVARKSQAKTQVEITLPLINSNVTVS
mmetsp:Transcript_15378/g.44615  ORF Transcript_15378/g.44615 Transcript_15378/m.44615 type:complete len:432 (-) Transcript_15378:75-1370(-)